ncbi:MAG: hypothetical protein ABSF70_11530 [Terracidiphilus sp.]
MRNDQVVGRAVRLPTPDVCVEGVNAVSVGAGPVNKRLKHGWADIDGVDLDGGVLAQQTSSEATIAIP